MGVVECIYRTLIVPGPTYHFFNLHLGHPTGRRLSPYHLLENATFQHWRPSRVGQENPRGPEKEQPPLEHPRSLRQGDDPGLIPAALTPVPQRTRLWKNPRSKLSLQQLKINEPQISPQSRYSNNCKPSCRAHTKKRDRLAVTLVIFSISFVFGNNCSIVD